MLKYVLCALLTVAVEFAGAQSISNITAKNVEGKNVKLSDLDQDQPLVLSFWATWCLPCMEELNAVNEKIDAWKSEKKFNFVAVSTDDPRTANKVKTVVKGKNWNFDDVLVDPSQSMKRQLNIANVPMTLVFYKDKLVYTHVGYVPGDEDELFEKIKQLQ